MSTTQQPLVFDSDRGVPRPARADEPLAVGALTVAGGVGQFGQSPPATPTALPGDWGATLQAVIQQLLASGAATDSRDRDWSDGLGAAVALSRLGPYQSGRIIIGSSQGWTVLDQPAAASGRLRALVARSGAVEQVAPGVSAASLGYADVVAYGAQAPAAAVDGTLWFSEVPEQGVQVRSPAGWRRLENLLRDASTALPGLARLADAAAISNGTAGRVVDAAQLWAVHSKADAAQAAADGAQATADGAQATADGAQAAATAAQGSANAAQATANGAQAAANGAQTAANQAQATANGAQTAAAGAQASADAAQAAASAAQATANSAWKPVDATTTTKGLVQLADAAALNTRTAGRIVDAAQLNATGRVLNTKHFRDPGGVTASQDLVSANQADFIYQPVSDNSVIYIWATFELTTSYLTPVYSISSVAIGMNGQSLGAFEQTAESDRDSLRLVTASALHEAVLINSSAPISFVVLHSINNPSAYTATQYIRFTVVEVAN